MKKADKQFAIEQFTLMLDNHYDTAREMFLAAFTAGFDRAKAEVAADSEMEKKMAYQVAKGDYEAFLLLEDKVASFCRLALTRQRRAKEALYGTDFMAAVDPTKGRGHVITTDGSGGGRGAGAGTSDSTVGFTLVGGSGSKADGSRGEGGSATIHLSGRGAAVMHADGTIEYSDGSVGHSDTHNSRQEV